MLIQAFFLFLVVASLADPQNVVRPCRPNHVECIRENLEANSKCNGKVRGSVPAEYVIPQLVSHTAYFNASFIDRNLVIRNHNLCIISEFFYNVPKDSAVIALDCPNLDFQSSRTLIQHHSLQEDTEYKYDYRGVYPLIRLTVNMRGADAMDLCNTLAFADVTALPKYLINPADRKTYNYLSRDLSLLNTFEREYIWWRANLLARYYINSVICDFGCNS